MNWKNYLVAVLLSSIIILALAFIHNSGSQTTFQYDPWADINDDGYIDVKDISYTCRLFGTTGDPTKVVKSISLTHNGYNRTIIKPKSRWSLSYRTEGFKEINIAFWARYNSSDIVYPSPYLEVEIILKIHDVELPPGTIYLGPTSITVDNFNITAKPCFSTPFAYLGTLYDVFKTYQIRGVALTIWLYNPCEKFEMDTAIGVYMTS